MKIEKIKNVKQIILPKNDIINNKCDEEYAKEFVLELDKEYKFKDSLNVQLKNSVSAILKETNGEHIYEKEDFVSQTMYEDALLESAELGTLYHNAMQCYKLKQTDDEFCAEINQKFTKEEKLSLNMEKLLIAKRNMDEKTKGCKNIYQEQKFMMYVPHRQIFNSNIDDKILIQGIIDIAIEFEDKILVVDYKTNKTKNKKYLLEHYTKQLELYKMAVELSFKKSTFSSLYAFSIDEFIMNN